MHDEGYKLIAKLFKFVGGVKMYASGDFRTPRNQSYVRCMHKSESGLLYFMEKSIFFVHKPTLQITYDVRCAWFLRDRKSAECDTVGMIQTRVLEIACSIST